MKDTSKCDLGKVDWKHHKIRSPLVTELNLF